MGRFRTFTPGPPLPNPNGQSIFLAFVESKLSDVAHRFSKGIQEVVGGPT